MNNSDTPNPIRDNESAYKSNRVVRNDDGISVVMDHRSHQDSVPYQVRTVLDFSACSEDDILILAAESAIIKWRKDVEFLSKNSVVGLNNQTVDVKNTLLVGKRKSISNRDKVDRALDKITAEEAIEILKQKIAESGMTVE